MTLTKARTIALGSPTAKLGQPSKLPGHSWGISAQLCQRGSELDDNPNSPCSRCYARKNFYATWWPVRVAQRRRLLATHNPEWAAAMIRLIEHCTSPLEPYFRWFDSGDLQGAWMLKKIVDVCVGTPRIKHWLATHEPFMVQSYLEAAAAGVVPELPDNLCLRISGDVMDLPAKLPPGTEHLPTSTVHRFHGNPFVVEGIECKAYLKAKKAGAAGECGKCRACWDPRIGNISYPVH
jgi:hypothetical protein